MNNKGTQERLLTMLRSRESFTLEEGVSSSQNFAINIWTNMNMKRKTRGLKNAISMENNHATKYMISNYTQFPLALLYRWKRQGKVRCHNIFPEP
jgi:hypothetical protein